MILKNKQHNTVSTLHISIHCKGAWNITHMKVEGLL